jgi:hypothetical protein
MFILYFAVAFIFYYVGFLMGWYQAKEKYECFDKSQGKSLIPPKRSLAVWAKIDHAKAVVELPL